MAKKISFRFRRLVGFLLSLAILSFVIYQSAPPIETAVEPVTEQPATVESSVVPGSAMEALAALPTKGRAPKTDYSRDQFGSGWTTINGCDTRNIILNRDLIDVEKNEKCEVVRGTLNDSYTGNIILFERGASSSAVQIDHVVALSDAWQKGAQSLTRDQRIALANDPLELIAADGPANQQKSDGDAATWLPSNKPFRCQYVARQIAVKQKYSLWVTQAEHDAMSNILNTCPDQVLPQP